MDLLGDILWPHRVAKTIQEGQFRFFFVDFLIFFFKRIGNPTLEKTRRNTGIPVNTGQLAPLIILTYNVSWKSIFFLSRKSRVPEICDDKKAYDLKELQ
jgi:hypothetical protein